MATLAPADPSTRPLSEVARHIVIPEGIVDTLWFEVEEQCAEWGDSFDAWQDGLGQLLLGIREDGLYAATVGGNTLSIPRQVAKTFIVGRIVFALAARFPDMTILWTAHRIRTASQTFDKLKGLAKRPSVRPYMLDNASGGIRSVNGEQEFHFRNGSKMMFGAREHGFGRGFDEVDIEVFDEAQILTEKALEDMVAATNQSRFPHGALLFFMGTPPRPTDAGEEFAARRRKALALKADDEVMTTAGQALYVECSADPEVGKPGGPDLDDPTQVSLANPSYPHRTPPVSVQRLRENLSSDDSWRREGLGVWDALELHRRVVSEDDWLALIDDGPALDEKPNGLAVDASHDREFSVAACWSDDEFAHAEEVFASGDEAATLRWVASRAGRRIPVLIDSASPAASLIPALKAQGVDVRSGSAGDMSKACGLWLGDVKAQRFTHGNQDSVNDALAGATQRDIGNAGGWGWDRRDPSVNIAPLVAHSLARLAATFRRPRSTNSDRSSSRRAVVR